MKIKHLLRELGRRIWPRHAEDEVDRLTVWRERIISAILLSLIVLGVAPLISSFAFALERGDYGNIVLFLSVYLAYFVLLLAREIPYRVRVWATAGGLYLLAVMSFVSIGPLGSYRVYLFAATVTVGLLLALRSGLIALAVSVGIGLVTTSVVLSGEWSWPTGLSAIRGSLPMTILVFSALVAVMTLSLAALVRSLEDALDRQTALTSELAGANAELQAEMDRRRKAEAALRESESRYRLLVENQTDLLVRVDPEGRFTFVSPSYCATFGRSEEDLVGHSFMPLVHEDDRETTVEAMEALYEPPHRSYVEQRAMTVNGWRWFGWMDTAVLDRAGDVTGVIGVGRDITELKEAELALRESEEMMRYIIKHDPNAMAVFDTDLRYIAVSDRYLEDYGLEEGEVLGRHHYEVFPELPQRLRDVHTRVLSGVVERSDDDHFERADGSITYNRWECRPWYTAEEQIGGMITYTEVTTARKLAEIALRESESRLRSYVENAPYGIVITDGEGRLLEVNPGAAALTGYTEAELQTMHFTDLVPAAMHQEAADWYRRLMAEGKATIESPYPSKNGQLRYWSVSAVRLGPDRYMTFVADITDRKLVVEELGQLLDQVQDQRRRIQGILDTVPEGVVLIDAQGDVLLANPVAHRALAILSDAAVGDRLTHLGDRALEELLTSPPDKLRHEVKVAGRIYEVIARPLARESGYHQGDMEHYVVVLSEVTAERQVQAELAQQERLAAVGQLAAGIAHDFNNILAVIVLYAQMDLGSPELPPRVKAHFETILREANHAASLVEQILDFGRRAVLDPSPMDMVPFLKEQCKLLNRTLPESIRLDLALNTDQAVVRADPTRMRQVLTNLAVNARDAMPDGGRLEIAVERLRVDGKDEAAPPDLRPGHWMMLAVGDTGTGMSPEVQRHLFEPFYTTKGTGEGTGLGLAQVYGIVKQHDGAIDVETEEGVGTTFRIYLPLAAEPDLVVEGAERAELAKGRGESVLIVEDDPALREALVSTLALLGYRTEVAANGREALAVLTAEGDGADASATGGAFDLVLSDLVMPELGGEGLYYAMREAGVRSPMIIISGHPMVEALRKLKRRGLDGWLLKPVQMESLAELVDRVLHDRSA